MAYRMRNTSCSVSVYMRPTTRRWTTGKPTFLRLSISSRYLFRFAVYFSGGLNRLIEHTRSSVKHCCRPKWPCWSSNVNDGYKRLDGANYMRSCKFSILDCLHGITKGLISALGIDASTAMKKSTIGALVPSSRHGASHSTLVMWDNNQGE
jgi:hypothetical protein